MDRGERQQTLLLEELVVDYFAGGGGASEAIAQALGREVDVAINHCPAALAMHEANHPRTKHLKENVWDVDPERDIPSGPVAMAWFLPTCTHFSRARGGKPVSKQLRALPWTATRFARARKPTVVFLENVPEFLTWGPVGDDGVPVESKKGATFRAFVRRFERLGYAVEWRVLNAADYGAPTFRKRLFLVARRDGKPIVWPAPTHGPGRGQPYLTAASCIDWSLPCPSIFDRKRPLAEATQRRIAEGIRRYVLAHPRPFIVQVNHGRDVNRSRDVAEPMPTISTKHGFGVVTPTLVANNTNNAPRHVEAPLGTVTTGGRHIGLVTAFLARFIGPGTSPLVTIDGEEYAIVDIGLRMLTPRELARAQGFPDSYVLTGTATDQVGRIGNSVSPPVARALVEANAPAGARRAG